MGSHALRVVSAREAGWDAVESLMMCEASSRNCWCQFHVLDNRAACETTRKARRALLVDQVESLDPPRGLIAMAGDEPKGWCGVEPRARLRHVLSTRLVSKNSLFPLDDPDVWTVYCILVPPAHRRSGVATHLLTEALAHAESHGARAVEALPFDTSQRDGVLPQGLLDRVSRHVRAPGVHRCRRTSVRADSGLPKFRRVGRRG